ncbi:MAG: hypothetical protein AAGJ54_11940 [Planctomycetota bacterium]
MNAIQKLRQLTDAITANTNPLQTQRDWELVARLLMRASNDLDAIDDAVKTQDAAKLDAIVSALENPQAAAPKPAKVVDSDAFGHDDKAAALRAFKKRLKIMRLSDESKLGGRYTSGGKHSKIDAIEPPTDYPAAMWKALAAEGKLVDTGQGFYSLPE